MAFCQNCGNQLADDQLFCPACGTKNGAAQAASSNKVLDYIKNMPKSTMFMYIAGILNLLNILFLCLKTIFIKSELFEVTGASKSSLVSLFGDLGLSGVGVICLIISILLCVLAAASVAAFFVPAVSQLLTKKIPLKLVEIFNIAAGAFAIHFLFIGQIAVAGLYGYYGKLADVEVTVGATFAGWLVGLIGLAAIVLTVLSIKFAAKENK